ncbi:MAG: hypothetical protein OEZ01_02530 [Candidatus Heimdallarchaeota archaeon]|nr:hypothetical protein [Candidatus Heimdallarchaeota archaeon]
MNIYEFGINCRDLIQVKLKACTTEDANILLISHGGVLELSTIVFFPNFDYKQFGNSSNRCGGVDLQFSDGKCINISKINV